MIVKQYTYVLYFAIEKLHLSEGRKTSMITSICEYSGHYYTVANAYTLILPIQCNDFNFILEI